MAGIRTPNLPIAEANVLTNCATAAAMAMSKQTLVTGRLIPGNHVKNHINLVLRSNDNVVLGS